MLQQIKNTILLLLGEEEFVFVSGSLALREQSHMWVVRFQHLDAGSLVHHSVYLASWSTSVLDFCLDLPCCWRNTEFIDLCYHAWLFMGVKGETWVLNFFFFANTLLISHCSHSHVTFKLIGSSFIFKKNGEKWVYYLNITLLLYWALSSWWLSLLLWTSLNIDSSKEREAWIYKDLQSVVSINNKTSLWGLDPLISSLSLKLNENYLPVLNLDYESLFL